MKEFDREEVAKHGTEGDLWIVVDAAVYDLSKFVDMHPGGAAILLDKDVAGKDTTDAFFGLHTSEVLKKYKRLQIGTIKGEKPQWILPQAGALSQVPFAEPIWLSKGLKSPYYDDSHRALQKFMRKFVDEEIIPEARVHEKTNERPTDELFQKLSETKITHMRLGPGPWLHGLTLGDGALKGEDYTYLHELVVNQEIARMGARGFADGLQGGFVIGTPPILNFGSKALQARVIPDLLASKKHACLAVSEPYAGSDVAGLRTTAVKTPDGKFWIINGAKKWITGGHWADYFSVACRTGKKLTMILVERGEGVETKLIKTSYSTSAGTSYVTFDNVKVPVENTLGPEGQGLMVVLSNFNHERWVMCCASIRSTRYFIEQTFIWANVRQAFGKRLIDQPVLRQKFARMFADVEAAQSWLEKITYNMCHMNYKQQSDLLAGQIGLLKAFATRIAHHAADECVQIFGGRGITQSGMGSLIEGFQRTQKFDALLGGAEEILFDLGVRQAQRKHPKAAL